MTINMTIHNTVDFDDIQGLVRFAHGQLASSAFLLLAIANSERAKRWLASAPITTAAARNPPPDMALQVAFTANGLVALGISPQIMGQFSREFTEGMAADDNRTRRLGDTGNNAPRSWQWGGSHGDSAPHLVLMLYTRPERLDSALAALQDDLFCQAFNIQSTLITRQNRSTEPFGFEDGISQPLIDWQQALSTDVHQRDRYGNWVALGEILLGYPNEYGLYTARPLLNPGDFHDSSFLPEALEEPQLKDLGRNGTYLVFRQLEQDVQGFWTFIDRQVGGNAEQRELLAAAMVGRHRDGTPVVDNSKIPIDGIDSNNSKNHFSYDDDPLGNRCPIGAHVRRSNPRTGDYPVGVTGIFTRLVRTLGFCPRHAGDDLIASTRFHRLLRRGRIYGPAMSIEEALQSSPGQLPGERGLHFICLCANIARQFEFVQSAWNVSPKFAGLSAESDPLLGNRQVLLNSETTDKFTLPQAGLPARVIDGLPQFVRVKGGAYFFLPGIRALRFIVS